MTDLRLPCREGNPDDWFLSKDGKQYADEDLLPPEALEEIQSRADSLGLEGTERVEAIERATSRAETDAKTAALQRRRHAKEACFESCLFRTRCLDRALHLGLPHGTWGGYYEEEIRELRRKIAARDANYI